MPAPTFDDPIPVVGYIRVSTWREEKISPDIQRAAITSWAARNGRRVVDWVEDLDQTGRNFKRKIMQAIAHVETGFAKEIAVWKFNRFGRNRHGIAINLERVERVGGKLKSVTEDVDAGTATGRFHRGVLFEVAAFESDRTGEQWKEVHQHRLAALLPAGGRPRFGYIWYPRRIPDPFTPGGWRLQSERYEVDPDVAPIVADLYSQYIAGVGFIGLARQLNARGLTTTRGRPWSMSSLLRYMDSGFPAGLLQVRDSCKCPPSSSASCRHWRRFPGAHPPIIALDGEDPEQKWQEYQARRQSVRKLPPRARTPRYELTGLVRCAQCRGAMSAHPRPGEKQSYWRCARSDQGGVRCRDASAGNMDLLGLVRGWLSEIADEIDKSPSAPQPAPPKAAADQELHHKLEVQHARLRDALTRLVTDYALYPERYPDDAYDGARERLESERNRVLAQLAQLQATEDRLDAAEFHPVAVGLMEEWDTLPLVSRNLILRKLIRYVWVGPRPSRCEMNAEVVPVWAPDKAGVLPR